MCDILGEPETAAQCRAAVARLKKYIPDPGDSKQVVNYVLRKPSQADATAIVDANRRTLDVMPLIFEGNIEKAMHALHSQE